MNNPMRRMKGNESKPKDKKYVIKRLWNYLYKFKWLLLLAFFLTITANLLALAGPMLLKEAIKAINFGEGKVDFENVYFYALLMAVFYISSSILSYILSRVMIRISKKVVFKMREDAFEKLTSLPVSYFDKNRTGDIISKMTYDIDTINTSLSSDLISICTSVITIVGSLIMMIIISPIMVLVFVFTIPISLLFTRYMLKKTRKLFRARSQKLGELNGYAEEMITGNKTINAYYVEPVIQKRFDKYNKEATDAAYKAEYYGSITGPGVNFVNNLSLSLICVFGAFLFVYRSFGIENIAAFIQYSRKFSGPINEVANLTTDLQSALAAGERVFGLIDAKEEALDSYDALTIEHAEGKVEFEHVDFGYTEQTIIHDLSFAIEPGKVVAIVGPTGAGKTTIVNLLMRFYDIQKGNIKLDSHSIMDITRKSLRKSYAMVLQDTWLFEGTFFENIAYGKENATLEEVIEASKKAKIDSYIRKLPNGYNTILNEDGINISKGQKQLLTIARSMLLESNMLILDEATSNVDTRTEIAIQEAMKELMKDKTCFIIAHRLSTIQNADLILVVHDGEIVEKGRHDELLNKNGYYKELYYSQFN